MRDDSPTFRRVTRRTWEMASPHRKRRVPPERAKRDSPSGPDQSLPHSRNGRPGRNWRAIARQHARSLCALLFVLFFAFNISRLFRRT